MILSVKGKLKGAMTYWFEEWNETYKVGPIWHIGDFDTAKGTSGMGTQCCPALWTYMARHFICGAGMLWLRSFGATWAGDTSCPCIR